MRRHRPPACKYTARARQEWCREYYSSERMRILHRYFKWHDFVIIDGLRVWVCRRWIVCALALLGGFHRLFFFAFFFLFFIIDTPICNVRVAGTICGCEKCALLPKLNWAELGKRTTKNSREQSRVNQIKKFHIRGGGEEETNGASARAKKARPT